MRGNVSGSACWCHLNQRRGDMGKAERRVLYSVLGPLPKVTSAPLVSVPNPHLCALRLEFSCSSIVCAFNSLPVLPFVSILVHFLVWVIYSIGACFTLAPINSCITLTYSTFPFPLLSVVCLCLAFLSYDAFSLLHRNTLIGDNFFCSCTLIFDPFPTTAKFDNEVLQQEHNSMVHLEINFQHTANELHYLRNSNSRPNLNLPQPPSFSGIHNELHTFKLLSYVNFSEVTITRIQISNVNYCTQTVSSLALPATGMSP